MASARKLPPLSMDETTRDVVHALQDFAVESDRYLATVRRVESLASNDVHAIREIRDAEDDGQALTPGALAQTLLLSPAATTALVDRLVGLKLVKRQQSVHDGRTSTLHCTARARHLSREMFHPMMQRLIATLEAQPQRDHKVVTRLVGLLTAEITAARHEL